MEQLDIILVLMALLAGLYVLAEKIRVSYPILLVLAGLGIGAAPDLPNVELTPDVTFLLFLPPLLFDAARNTSWHDFKKHRYPIVRLAFGLTLFTTVGVATLAHYMIDGFSWPLAFVLGAIVSPPDVVAATSATKTLNLPKNMITILEGESLVNDAAALITYRYAVLAVVTGTFVFWEAATQFMLVALGGIVIGAVIGQVFTWMQKQFLSHSTVGTVATLLVPYMSYLLAEHVHMSGVLSVVTTGLIVSWRAHEIFSYQTRLQMNGFWQTLIFLLNGLIFILIGLQLPAIMRDIEDHAVSDLILDGVLITLALIVIRFIWVFATVYGTTALQRLRKIEQPAINNKQLIVVAWAGMRGIVSLATALALPLTLQNNVDFPQRNVILFITFVVILLTLVVQGLTLPPLIRRLDIAEPPEKAHAEERRLRLALARGALSLVRDELTGKADPYALREVKNRLERQIAYLNGVLKSDWADKNEDDRHHSFFDYLRSEQAVIKHQRAMLVEMHKKGGFDADSLRRIEQDMDARSLIIAGRMKAYTG